MQAYVNKKGAFSYVGIACLLVLAMIMFAGLGCSSSDSGGDPVGDTQYSVSVNTEGNGYVTVEPESSDGLYDADSVITITAYPDQGWLLSGWDGDLSGSELVAQVTMDSSKSVTATFLAGHMLNVTTNGQGSVTMNPDGGIYLGGTEVVLNVSAEPGWEFQGWTGDHESTEESLTISMDAEKTVSAKFIHDVEFDVDEAKSLITTENIVSVQSSETLSIQKEGDRQIPTFIFSKPTPEADGEKTVGIVRSAAADMGVMADEVSGKTNLIAINEDGVATPAVSAIEELSIIYTVLSPDRRKVYVVLDPDEMHNATHTIGMTNCMLFVVDLADNSYSCLDEGYAPQVIDSSYRQTISNSKSKPIQMDEEGNVYHLGRPFNINENTQCQEWSPTVPDLCVSEQTYYWPDIDWGMEPVIRKIAILKDQDGHPLHNADGSQAYADPVSLTPDNNYIDKFLVSKDGLLVYTYANHETGNGGIKMYTNGSTNELTDDTTGWWGQMFFTVGDAGTVIFGSSSDVWGNEGIKFAKAHETIPDARRVVQLNTSLFTSRNNSPTPSRIILADDGYIYGLFNEDASYWDESISYHVNRNRINLFRVLPYKETPIFSVLHTGDWWQVMNQFDVQISKGYAYWVMTDKHPQGIYGERDVIKITKLSTGETQTLLDNGEMIGVELGWLDRYELYSWKLIDGIIYFSGFNNATSQVVVGEIDILKMREGLPALPENEDDDHFLSIQPAASALGESAKIKDMEIVRPEAVMDPQGYPVITKIYTDPENLYSASIDFSKYMDRDDVRSKTTVTDTTSEAEIDYCMKIWSYKTMHLIFDTDLLNSTTDPLLPDTQYSIALDGTARDFTGLTLGLVDPPYILSNIFKTVPDHGWYQSTAIALEDFSDGSVGKYVAQSGTDFYLEHFRLLGCTDVDTCPGFENRNFKLEFSLQHLSEGGEVVVRLNDARRINWNNVNWSQTSIVDSLSFEWRWQDGHRVDASGSQYFWCNREICGVDVEGFNVEGIYNQDDVVYTYVQGHDEDLDGNQYFNYWDDVQSRSGYKVYDADGVYLFNILWKDGWYMDAASETIYEWSFGEYRDTTNPDNILDWDSGVNYVWYEGHYERVDNGEIFDKPGLQWVTGMYIPPTGNPISDQTYWDMQWVDGYFVQYDASVPPAVPTGETTTEWGSVNAPWVETVQPEDMVENKSKSNWDSKLWEISFSMNSGNTIWGDYRTGLDTSRQIQTTTDQLSRREWHKISIAVYGKHLDIAVFDADGQEIVTIEHDDYSSITRTDSDFFFLDFDINEDTIKMDNVTVTELDENGFEVLTDDSPNRLFFEDFSSAAINMAFANQRWYDTDW